MKNIQLSITGAEYEEFLTDKIEVKKKKEKYEQLIKVAENMRVRLVAKEKYGYTEMQNEYNQKVAQYQQMCNQTVTNFKEKYDEKLKQENLISRIEHEKHIEFLQKSIKELKSQLFQKNKEVAEQLLEINTLKKENKNMIEAYRTINSLVPSFPLKAQLKRERVRKRAGSSTLRDK